MNNEQRTKKYTLISLFSGCGGADLGFLGDFEFLGEKYSPLPFEIIWANDIDKYAYQVYQGNINNRIEFGDISKVKFEKIGSASQSVDLLLGGFPCQAFSLMGLRKGLKVPRGQLYKQMRRAIRYFEPKIFLAENVPGIEYPPSTIKTIISGLRGRKPPLYEVDYYRVNTADYGIPQFRKRIIIVGIRNDLPKTFVPPPATHCSPNVLHDNKKTWVSAKDAIESLWNPDDLVSNVDDQDKLTHATIYFKNDYPQDGQVNPNQPCTTIRAEHHGHVQVHYNVMSDGSLRRLTIRECARIQGFPDSFSFPVPNSQAYRQIGNAISPVLAHHWAVSIRDWLDSINCTDSQ